MAHLKKIARAPTYFLDSLKSTTICEQIPKVW